MAYIVVSYAPHTDLFDAVELAREIEKHDGVIGAILVGTLDEYCKTPEDKNRSHRNYVGEFYSTPQAIERLRAANPRTNNEDGS